MAFKNEWNNEMIMVVSYLFLYVGRLRFFHAMSNVLWDQRPKILAFKIYCIILVYVYFYLHFVLVDY